MPQAKPKKNPSPTASGSPAPRSHATWASLTAALVTAGLLWQCYFPAAFGWQAWFALVPWLMLVRADLPNRRRYVFAWLSGLAFLVPALSWMRTGYSEMVVFWLLLSLYCSWYYAAALWLIRRLDRRTRLPLTVTVPVVWAALEFARGELMGGFAWYYLGHSQHGFLPVIQVADVAGVAAVTALVAAVNGLLAEAVERIAAVRRWFGMSATGRRPALRIQALTVATVLAFTLGYGSWRLSQGELAAGPRVALLQPSIPQTERNAASVVTAGDPLAQQSIEQQMSQLTNQALREPVRPDVIIWPETTFPWELKSVTAGAPEGPELAAWRKDMPDRQRFAQAVVEASGTNVLLGLNTRVYGADGRTRRFNSALLLTPTGETVGRYDKMHLVPFGEYIPMKDLFPFVQQFSPYGANDYTIAPGEAQTRFPLSAGGRAYQFGVLICYEDAVASLARELVRPNNGPPADFLVNISNDGWFMGTSEHAEHLAVSRFRAVECRRAVLRAVNGGISAIIDGSGRVVALPAETWSKSKAVTGVVSGTVPLDTRASPYARFGDWLPWSCWGLLLLGCCRRPTPRSNP